MLLAVDVSGLLVTLIKLMSRISQLGSSLHGGEVNKFSRCRQVQVFMRLFRRCYYRQYKPLAYEEIDAADPSLLGVNPGTNTSEWIQ